jgi:hypothetical protein
LTVQLDVRHVKDACAQVSRIPCACKRVSAVSRLVPSALSSEVSDDTVQVMECDWYALTVHVYKSESFHVLPRYLLPYTQIDRHTRIATVTNITTLTTMASQHNGICIYIAPSIDSSSEITGTPNEYLRVFLRARGTKDELLMFEGDIAEEYWPKKRPERDEKTTSYYLLTYLQTNTLHSDTQGKASKNVPITDSWKQAQEVYSKTSHSIQDVFGPNVLVLYYLGEHKTGTKVEERDEEEEGANEKEGDEEEEEEAAKQRRVQAEVAELEDQLLWTGGKYADK